jgi:cyanophycinase-like exopeptidase
VSGTDSSANGKGLAHEFVDKLIGAEAVYFSGGDQWPYVQVLGRGPAGANAAAQIISDGNSAGKVAVGGTSAGLAILGQYVFTAKWGPLTSNQMLTNCYNSDFYHDGDTAIASDVLGLNLLDGVLAETHFTDVKKASTDLSGREVYRLGRFVEFLGSIMLSRTVKGIAIDESTALTIDKSGHAEVFGEKAVYFASADATTFSVELVNPAPGIHRINVAAIDLRQWRRGQRFQLRDGWNFDSAATDVLAVIGGDLLWLDGEPFF